MATAQTWRRSLCATAHKATLGGFPFYGPSGGIYGEEACAGVINIILKETERPVFTQADLSFGRFSYNSLDLMFGGKLGRDKNIFRYSIYGSNTVRENTDYYYDQNLFNTNHYLSFGLDSSVYSNNGNYRGGATPKDSFARTGVLPHESRMFGVNLTWRGMHFTYHRLSRFDRSALGINPLAVSYANPSNRLAERIEMFKRPAWCCHQAETASRISFLKP